MDASPSTLQTKSDSITTEKDYSAKADALAQKCMEILFGDSEVEGEEKAFERGSDDGEVMLEGLQEELQKFGGQEVVEKILGKGSELRSFAVEVEENLKAVELESIQDYVLESENLVSLQEQIQLCDSILNRMENVLGGFQSDLGAVSSEIKGLQSKSMSLGVKLRNLKAAEGKLAQFLEDVVVPPDLIQIILQGEVDDVFVKALESLSRKLLFVEGNSAVQISAAYKDVQPELERLKFRAIVKSRDFLLNRMWALRKPKTNIQILQQNVLLKYKMLATFLKRHTREAYSQVVTSYVDTLSKVLSLHFRSYILALGHLQLDIASKSDLIGEPDSQFRGSVGIFSKSRDLKNRATVFSLGERASLLKNLDQAAIVPHVAEDLGQKFPYEVLFRSLQKLLMDAATSEYLFCTEFFGEESTFQEIFQGPFAVIEEHLQNVLPQSFDAIGLLLMIRIIHHHQSIMSKRGIPCLDAFLDKLNMLLWPRFKLVLDLHLQSVKSASPSFLWVVSDDVHPHYVARRYAEFSASMLTLNTEGWNNQLEVSLDRLRSAVDHLLVQLSHRLPKQKQRTVFLINNYDLILAVMKEAGVYGGKATQQFEELLGSFTTVFVEEELKEYFGPLIDFVKKRAGLSDDSVSGASSLSSVRAISPQEVQPLLRDFSNRWKSAIELMHKDVLTNFSNFVCGMDVLRAALTQLLLYYTRLSDCVKNIGGGTALMKEVVSIPSIMYEIRKYSRTF